jgi:hypothetical protein
MLVGGRAKQHGEMAVQCKRTTGPEIQTVAQGFAGKAVELAPGNRVGFGAGRDCADDDQGDEFQAGRGLTFWAHLRNIPCFPLLKAHP